MPPAGRPEAAEAEAEAAPSPPPRSPPRLPACGENAAAGSKYTSAEDGRVVAIVYPIHEMTPSMPPTIIMTDSCSTIGLHSESMRR